MTHAHAPHVHATLHDYLYNVCTWSYSRQVHIWEALISDGITDQSFPDVMPVLPRLYNALAGCNWISQQENKNVKRCRDGMPKSMQTR